MLLTVEMLLRRLLALLALLAYCHRLSVLAALTGSAAILRDAWRLFHP